MSQATIRTLSERLSRLEAENRRLRRAGAVVVAPLAGLALMGQARSNPGRIVEGERFVLRDAKGTVRGALGLGPDGAAGLALTDPDGRLRASLTVGLDGLPALGLFDRDERSRVAVILSAGGAPSLRLYDAAGQARAGLIVGSDGFPEVVLQR